MMDRHGIEITGLGALTPFGRGVEALWEAVIEARSAFSPIRLFPTEGHRTHWAAEIPGSPVFEPRRLDVHRLSRADTFALIAAEEALRQAGLLEPGTGILLFPERTGITVGTAAGGILGIEGFFRKQYLREPVDDPRGLLQSFCLSSIAANIGREFGIQGPRMTTATVCSSSGLALGGAMDLLRSGELDAVLVVGTEALSEVTHAGFNCLRSVDPERCRPFDRNRKGLVLGEGAGAMVLERPDAMARRSGRSLGRLLGYGLTTDTYHFTAPDPTGAAIAETISRALSDAGVKPGRIDYVNAHGTGTLLNDVAETRGLKGALGSHAARIPVSSSKSMIGHALGAASILEGIITVLGLRDGVVPPTLNLETPDPDCDLDYVPEGPRKAPLHLVLSNSFAFGGSNLSLVFAGARGREASPPAPSPVAAGGPRRDVQPVITGIGVVSPIGVGKEAFSLSIAGAASGLVSLGPVAPRFAGTPGGLVDQSALHDRTPQSIRRRMNRQAAFLYPAVKEAMEDAGLETQCGPGGVLVYGSAYGCSGNVHRFFHQLLSEGPRLASPQEFNMSVTNAPAALVAQELGMKGPLWVFSQDEASWECGLHWAARLIRMGRAERVIVCGAEEISDSILAIHEALGMIVPGKSDGLVPGEGAVALVLENHDAAFRRGARIYGRLAGFRTIQDPSCGPLDFSPEETPLVAAAASCLPTEEERTGTLLLVGPDSGREGGLQWSNRGSGAVEALWPRGRLTRLALGPLLGVSGVSGGFGVLASILDPRTPRPSFSLVLTLSRGGVNAASFLHLA